MEFRDDDEEDDEAEESAHSSYRNGQNGHSGRGRNKTKSLDRTAGGKQASGRGPLIVKQQNGIKAPQGQLVAQTQPIIRQRQSQSFDSTAGFRHQNVSANVNAHGQPLRNKKQSSIVLKSTD